jgi:hypothetical protein
MSAHKLEVIALSLSQLRTHNRGQSLWSQGQEKVDGVYLIFEGEFEVQELVDFKNFDQEEQLQSSHISILKQENHGIKTLIEERVHTSQANQLKNKSVKHVVSLLGHRKMMGIEEIIYKQDLR